MRRLYFYILFLIMCSVSILHMNSVQLRKLKSKNFDHITTIHKTIYDIDENNRKIEFANSKYIYDIYEQNNDFVILNPNNKNKIKKLPDENNTQKYNMMKSFN